MKYGVREICDVVLKAKTKMTLGNKTFYRGEPVLYFDSLKTSSLEGAVQTVYAQGGRGNARLVAWDGERTLTFVMEDALISKEGIAILAGAGLMDASENEPIFQHVIEDTDDMKFEVGMGEPNKGKEGNLTVWVKELPYFPDAAGKTGFKASSFENYAYVLLCKDGDVISESYIPEHVEGPIKADPEHDNRYPLTIKSTGSTRPTPYNSDFNQALFDKIDSVRVDYYTKKTSGISQIDITPEIKSYNFYLEASTLFRDTAGFDRAAEFIIPNCKIQSNFTFSMASTGDPSTFNFTLDAFPDFTKFDKTKKVQAALQIVEEFDEDDKAVRKATDDSFIREAA